MVGDGFVGWISLATGCGAWAPNRRGLTLNSARLQILNIVQGLLARRATTASIETSEDLRAAGLTSLDMVNLMLAVEAEFDFTIPQGDITPENFQSVETLERLVAGQMATATAA